MSIWFVKPELGQLNAMSKNTMMEAIEIEFTEIGDNYIQAIMPVQAKTHQPLGMLHGGASVALAETIGSVASNLCVDHNKYYCVGLEINANHIKAKRNGTVTGTGKPLHIGKNTQVWEIKIKDENHSLICISRITMAVISKK